MQDNVKNRLLRGVKVNGFTTDQALEIWGVDKIEDVQDIGKALNALVDAKKANDAYGAPAQAGNGGGKGQDMALSVPEPEDVEDGALQEWGDARTLQMMAARARRYFGWAKNLPPGRAGDEMALATIQYSHLIGANPAAEIHAWWDDFNKEFCITPHYSFYVRVAKERCPDMTMFHEDVDPSSNAEVGSDDIASRCYIQTPAQRNAMLALMDRGVPYEKALEHNSTSAIGVLTYSEHTYTYGNKKGKRKNPPKGWTWRQRAETRALRNAISRAFGSMELTQAQRNLESRGLPGAVGEVMLDEPHRAQLAQMAYEEQPEVPPTLAEMKAVAVAGGAPEPVEAEFRDAFEEVDEADEEQEDEAEDEPAYDYSDKQLALRPPDSDELRTPAEVTAMLREFAGWREIDGRWFKASDEDAKPPRKKVVQRAAAILNDATGGDDQRHALLEAVFKQRSLDLCTAQAVTALIVWAEAEPGAWKAHPAAKQEADMLLQTLTGQKALFNEEA